MTITTVNGFQCRDCTDEAYAKRYIDPAHPSDGPFGVNASQAQDRSEVARAREVQPEPVVRFDGALQGVLQADAAADPSRATEVPRLLDIKV